MSWIHETHEDVADGALKDAYARIVRALGRVIPFYRAYSVSPPRGAMRAEDVAALREAGLSETEVFEVAMHTGYFNYTNRIGVGLGVEPE
jgi:hypothetical protein